MRSNESESAPTAAWGEPLMRWPLGGVMVLLTLGVSCHERRTPVRADSLANATCTSSRWLPIGECEAGEEGKETIAAGCIYFCEHGVLCLKNQGTRECPGKIVIGTTTPLAGDH